MKFGAGVFRLLRRGQRAPGLRRGSLPRRGSQGRKRVVIGLALDTGFFRDLIYLVTQNFFLFFSTARRYRSTKLRGKK